MGILTQRINSQRGQLNAYREAREKILTDRDLSQEAKVKRGKAIKEQAGAAAVNGMTVELVSAFKAAYKSVNARMARAQATADARWDHTRLTFETLEAKARLGAAQSVEEIEKEYDQAMEPHRRRAMQGAAMEALPRFLHAGGDVAIKANSLFLQIKRDNERDKTPPEMAALEAEASGLVDDVEAWRELAIDFGNEFWGQPSPLGSPDPFRAAIENLIEKVERVIDPATGKFDTKITFRE